MQHNFHIKGIKYFNKIIIIIIIIIDESYIAQNITGRILDALYKNLKLQRMG